VAELYKYDPQRGELIITAAGKQQINALLRRVGRSTDVNMHHQLAAALIEPIRKIAPYVEWTQTFFVQRNLKDGEDPALPLDDYTCAAFYTGPTGQALFTRPGRRYFRPDFTMIDVGLAIGWDDMANAGWDVLARKQVECAEELARKRDALAQAVLDAAVSSVAGHTPTVASSMTKAAVDSIFASANAAGWQITQVVINTGRAMDMTSWTWPADGMWLTGPERGEEILRQGYISNYGGAAWIARHTVPSNYVYFSVAPSMVGVKTQLGDTRTASDVDIYKKEDHYVWDERLSYAVLNEYGLWRLEIT